MTSGAGMDPKSIKAKEAAAAKAKADAEKLAAKQAGDARQAELEASYNQNAGIKKYTQSDAEKKAGVNALEFEGVKDIRTGELLDQYKVDPFKGEASQRLKAEALGTGPSDWAKAALDRQKFEEGQGASRAGLQQQTAQSSAQSQLMRQGGLGSGGRLSLARSGARDALMAQQNNAAQGIQQRFGINETDATRRQSLLGQTADVERGADVANIATQKEGLGAQAQFDANRYNAQMEAWGASEAAKAQRAAGGGGGKCFPEWTEIQMADDSVCSIVDIEVGQKVAGGGEVTEIRSYGEADGFQLYDYKGVDITGSHAVLELGKWIRVQDSVYGKLMDKTVDAVYTLVTENHLIKVNGITFSDDAETSEDYADEELSLKTLNKKLEQMNGAKQ